ncbi:MAG: hypothetical protein KKF56_04740 [Nanoarchaeota archaeon]|nr:hypothetical protein [Nanoarchaeota archaeon]
MGKKEGDERDLQNSNPQSGSRKWRYIILGVIAIILLIVVIFLFLIDTSLDDSTSLEGDVNQSQPQLLYEAFPVYANHSLLMPGEVLLGSEDPLEKISESEGDYLNENYYVQIPSQNHSSPINSQDSIQVNFTIPEELISEDNELFVKVNLACGEYGQIFIKSSNKFGGFDSLERPRCETENWEEKEIIISSGSVWTNHPVILLERTGGVGQVKIDSVEIYIMG